MEEKQAPLFSRKAIIVTAALGGPIAGGLLFAINFKRVDREKAARLAFIISVALWIVAILGIFSLPERFFEVASLGVLFPALWGALAEFFFVKYQKKDVQSILNEGGKKASGWVAFGLSIIGLILAVLILIPVALMQPPFEGHVVQLEETRGEVYYDGAATREQALLLGGFLEELEYFSPEEERAAKLETHDGRYNVLLDIEEQFWEDPALAGWLDALIKDLERHYEASVIVTVFTYRLTGERKTKIFRKIPIEGVN